MAKITIVAANVKRLLQEKNISQKEFAAMHHYEYKKLNNKLNGYESIYPEDVTFFYNALNCDANELFKAPKQETA